jgi:AraC-like DNA-binding protein
LRIFCATFGEMPHRYPQRRRAERAMFLLCESDRSVADLCFEVGSGSLGPSAAPSK